MWRLPPVVSVESVGIDTSNTRGTSISVPGSNNTKGSWTQIVASTSKHWQSFAVIWRADSTTAIAADIGIGGSGSEVILMPDLWRGSSGTRKAACWYIPLSIPAGTRIAARYQAAIAGTSSLYLALLGFTSHLESVSPFHRAKAFGFNSGTTGGTSIQASGTPNAKGSWVEFSSSTPMDIKELMVKSDVFNGAADILFDVGLGGSGSEQVVLPDLTWAGNTGLTTLVKPYVSFPLAIPAGTRIAARMQSATGLRTLTNVMYGFG